MSKVLVISASPRKGGNSDTLCDEFIRGALSSGHEVTKIRLAEKNINYCSGCGQCFKKGECSQKDDMQEILPLFESADSVVLATPVYFYCMNGQMKTFIDRCCPAYEKLSNKKFYVIVTAAEKAKDTFDETMAAFNGFFRCLDGAEVVKVIRGMGVFRPHEVKTSKAMEMAFLAGEDCQALACFSSVVNTKFSYPL